MDSEDIIKILRKQEEELHLKPTFYIHYDPTTLRIVNFRNYHEKSDQYPYVLMTEEEIGIPLKEFNVTNYFIKPKEKKIEKKEIDNILITKIDDRIYEIPKIISKDRITYADRRFDLLIEQNNPLKEFRLKLSPSLRETYYQRGRTLTESNVYVTAVNDPNILYKTLKFRFLDLIENEYYTIKFDDFEGNKVNIYSTKYFEDYLHVDIRDEDKINITRN